MWEEESNGGLYSSGDGLVRRKDAGRDEICFFWIMPYNAGLCTSQVLYAGGRQQDETRPRQAAGGTERSCPGQQSVIFNPQHAVMPCHQTPPATLKQEPAKCVCMHNTEDMTPGVSRFSFS